MTIAWLALAMSGAFFAAWMKPVLPNGEWFIAHRIFMVGSLIVGILGFILPFIAHARSPTPGLISFSSDVSSHNNSLMPSYTRQLVASNQATCCQK